MTLYNGGLISSEHVPQKAIRSLSLLVIWEIWCERNARVFRKQETSVPGLLSKIKNEAAVWALAGAKDLKSLIHREYSFYNNYRLAGCILLLYQ